MKKHKITNWILFVFSVTTLFLTVYAFFASSGGCVPSACRGLACTADCAPGTPNYSIVYKWGMVTILAWCAWIISVVISKKKDRRQRRE